MEKLYKKIGWKNSPNLATPLGATNLNKMDEAIDGLDNRTIELDTQRVNHKRLIDDLYSKTDALEKEIEEVQTSTEDISALKIIPTASGTTAYMDDASNMGLEGIDLYGESKQNGTPTPTSQIPIESKIVEKVIVSGKNFFGFGESAIDKTTELRPLAYQRLIFTKIDDNTIKCNYNGGTYSTGYVEFEGIDGTKDYAFSFIVEHNTLGFTPRIEKYASRCTTTRLSLMIYAGNGATEVSSSEYIILKNIQVELGTTATPFEQFKGIQTVNLSAPIELNGFGGVRDTDKLKNIYVKVFTGNEYFHTYTPGVGGIQFGCEDKNIMQIESENVLCTHLPPKFTWNVREDGIALTNSSGVVVRFRMESLGISTVEDLKAKLKEWYNAGNPMVLYAPIKTPIETELPQADIDAIKNLHTYKPNTVVMNDADAEMDVQYVADAKTYIDKKFESLASAIVNQ